MPNIRPVPDLQWQIINIVGPVMHMKVVFDPSQLILNGFPALVCSDNRFFPLSAVLHTDGLNITLNNEPAYPVTWTLASTDPAVRTAAGAYLACSTQEMTSGTSVPTAPAMFDWIYVSNDATSLTIRPSAFGTPPFLVSPGFMSLNSGAGRAKTVQLSGPDLIFTWDGGGPNSGDVATYYDAQLLTSGPTVSALLPSAVTIP